MQPKLLISLSEVNKNSLRLTRQVDVINLQSGKPVIAHKERFLSVGVFTEWTSKALWGLRGRVERSVNEFETPKEEIPL